MTVADAVVFELSLLLQEPISHTLIRNHSELPGSPHWTLASCWFLLGVSKESPQRAHHTAKKRSVVEGKLDDTKSVRWPLDFISWRDRKQSGQKVEPAKEKPKILSLIPQGSLPLVRYHLPDSINWRPSAQTHESTEIITFKPGAHMIQTQLTQATANLLTVD